MSAVRRRAEPQPWHQRSIAAWERFGADIVARRRALRKQQEQNLKRYQQVKR